MPDRRLGELLANAQQRLCAARRMLLRPRDCNLDECVSLLREAQGYLEWLRDSLAAQRSVPPGLRKGAISLAADIQQTGALLDQAARFGRRWLERLQCAAGYSADGLRPPLAPRGRLSILG